MLTRDAIVEALYCGALMIEPFNPERLNPCSYDLTLSPKIAYYKLFYGTNAKVVKYSQVSDRHTPRDYGHKAALPTDVARHMDGCVMVERPVIDLADEPELVEEELPASGFILYPGVIYLGMVNELIDCTNYVAELTGKSKLARAGLKVHQTAGYANLGDHFRFVLEIEVVHPTIIYPNMRIAQVLFWKPDDHKRYEYEGTYANKQGIDTDHIPGYIPDKELKERIAKLREAEIGPEVRRQIDDIKNRINEFLEEGREDEENEESIWKDDGEDT